MSLPNVKIQGRVKEGKYKEFGNFCENYIKDHRYDYIYDITITDTVDLLVKLFSMEHTVQEKETSLDEGYINIDFTFVGSFPEDDLDMRFAKGLCNVVAPFFEDQSLITYSGVKTVNTFVAVVVENKIVYTPF